MNDSLLPADSLRHNVHDKMNETWKDFDINLSAVDGGVEASFLS
jgi:hypothetical protein